MSFVSVEQLDKSYGATSIFRDIDFAAARGEFVTLLGPSGCGKSTLLRCIAGLTEVDSGRILIDGEDVVPLPPQKRGIAMVFQSYALFPNMTVQQNVAFGLRMQKVPAAELKQRVAEAIELVELGEYAARYPHQLSGGQCQRVALARSLVTRPRLLLLDEPLSALDARIRKHLREQIRRIQQELGLTTVFVTHDQEEALTLSDRIVLMNAGRIVQSGDAETLYTAPENAFAAGFIGNYNLLDAEQARPPARPALRATGGDPPGIPAPGQRTERRRAGAGTLAQSARQRDPLPRRGRRGGTHRRRPQPQRRPPVSGRQSADAGHRSQQYSRGSLMSLVIFDLDETMIHGDCSSLWSQRMASLGWVDESFVRRDAELMEQYAEGKLSMDLYMDYTLQPLIGRSVEEVEREVEAYVEEVIEPLIYSDACACLARHRSANDRVLIVSASGVHLVKPIAARIGVDEVLAIDLEVLDGHYTGRTLGTLTYREGKVLRLLDLLEGDDRQLADAWFYSDSRNDLPLLKLVGHPNTVNPDPTLLAYAKEMGWPVNAWR